MWTFLDFLGFFFNKASEFLEAINGKVSQTKRSKNKKAMLCSTMAYYWNIISEASHRHSFKGIALITTAQNLQVFHITYPAHISCFSFCLRKYL